MGGAAGMSAAPDGETAAIQTRAPKLAMTQRMVVTPVGWQNHALEAVLRIVQKSHTIQSLAPEQSRCRCLRCPYSCREMITAEPGRPGNRAQCGTLSGQR